MRHLAGLLAAACGRGVGGDTPLASALALAVVAALCSGAGGVAAVALEGARVPMRRVALWHAALGTMVLFGGVCDLLPEAAAGLSAAGTAGWFAVGATGAVVVGRVLREAVVGGAGVAGVGAVARHSYHGSVWGMLRCCVVGRRRGGRGEDGESNGPGGGGGGFGECDVWRALPVVGRVGDVGDGGAGDAALCERREVLVTGLAVFVCMSAHNLLEGMSILVAAHDGVEKGVRLAAAISLENVPEGLAIALPILYATRCPRTAVRLALLSGAVEPAGVLLAGVFMRPGTSQAVASSVLAVVSGILVSLALGQILPLAIKRSPRARALEFNAWSAVGIFAATIAQPLLMYHGRVGAVR